MCFRYALLQAVFPSVRALVRCYQELVGRRNSTPLGKLLHVQVRVCVRAQWCVCMCVSTHVKYPHIYLYVRFVTLVSSHVCASVSVICTRIYVFVNMCVRACARTPCARLWRHTTITSAFASFGWRGRGRAWIDGG